MTADLFLCGTCRSRVRAREIARRVSCPGKSKKRMWMLEAIPLGMLTWCPIHGFAYPIVRVNAAVPENQWARVGGIPA